MIHTFENKEPSLEEAQQLVGGYVEILNISPDMQVLVNEEGRMKGLPHNEKATALCGFNIVGPAVVLKGDARWG